MPYSALIRLLRTENVVIFLPVSPHSSTTWPHCTTTKEESWTESAYWRATASFNNDLPFMTWKCWFAAGLGRFWGLSIACVLCPRRCEAAIRDDCDPQEPFNATSP